ncbi:MAG TPA: type II toxin-antitoxin system prevent-host-death family antitoxin [Terriglobales bacterium]|nr:type II toxin-antitoxin system prevent-host-death family antitoxin [Terriglobales bacterium]
MQKVVSSADANRKFSEILRSVRKGHSYVVTSHGHPVARIVPAEESAATENNARNALFRRLKKQRVTNLGGWTREELYERS